MNQIDCTDLRQASGGLSFWDNTPLTIQNLGNSMIEVNHSSIVDLSCPKNIYVREIASIEYGIPRYTTKEMPNPQNRGKLASTNYEIFQCGVGSGILAFCLALCLFTRK